MTLDPIALRGHLAVIQRRLEGLKEAIGELEPFDVEFRFDQVQRAVEKMERYVEESA